MRAQNALKFLLATSLVCSVVAAGALVHLPDLHAKLHSKGTSCCCATGGSISPEDHQNSEMPEDHQCFIELLAAGCVDAPLAVHFIPLQFVPISEAKLLDREQLAPTVSSSALPGRAPPTC